MNLKSIKNSSEAPFKGVELIKTDGRIVVVVIGLLRIRDGQYTGIDVLVEQHFETATRHRVIVTIDGFGPKTLYLESTYEANAKARARVSVGENDEKATLEELIVDCGNSGGA